MYIFSLCGKNTTIFAFKYISIISLPGSIARFTHEAWMTEFFGRMLKNETGITFFNFTSRLWPVEYKVELCTTIYDQQRKVGVWNERALKVTYARTFKIRRHFRTRPGISFRHFQAESETLSFSAPRFWVNLWN